MAKKAERKRQAIPADESKKDKFVRVVRPRVDKVIWAIKQVALCAGSSYESTAEQQHKILVVLDKEFQSLKAAFEKKPQTQAGFTFEK